MVKKIKRFLVMAFFSFFWTSKQTDAAKVCLVQKTETGRFKYNGNATQYTAQGIIDEICDY